jgi:diguanylate cyclase (GGDEF)-like protein
MPTRSEILNAKVLLVDDDEDSVRLVQQLLEHEGYRSVTATTDPHKVSELYAEHRFDLIVLDLEMPGLSGFDVMQALKARENDYVPVLAVTGRPEHKLRALRAGAKDFVSKPFDWDEALVRVYNMLEVKLLLDEARDHARQLEFMALQDPLTGLANRRLLPERVWMAIAHARRNSSHMAVVYLDVDGFKDVNDTLGHAAGDCLLKAIGERLLHTVREEDTVARVGGDEFMIALWQVTGIADAKKVAEKLIDRVAQPYTIEGRRVTVTVSAGVSVYPLHGNEPDSLINGADTALYQAKRAGKNTYRLSEAASQEAAMSRRK